MEHWSDIAEEVARFYGYNNIPDTLSSGLNQPAAASRSPAERKTCWAPVPRAGYDEIITYSFISPTYYDKIDLPKDSPLRDS